MTAPTRSETVRGVATVTLDSPQNRNAFSQALLTSLRDDLQAAIDDPAVRVIVLTNTGTTFSAGADLKEDARSLPKGALTFGDIVDLVDRGPKPVVGRIAGHGAGAGAVLAAACDIAIAADTARLGITEVRLGIAPVPVAAMMAHRMGRRELFEAFLAADMMPAARAAELGMINLAVPADELDATVARYVDALVKGAPEALATTKTALQAMADGGVAANVAYGAHHAGALRSEEAREGVEAFLQKRPPAWIPAE
ncbi:MAG: enoyl-CoA hydratase/isomerase family protein [Acidimicrobiales bacterium]|nr:enoyl-CoA hydratase/isomerase family protein [Acidimicrobiales bacterium]